MQMMNETEFMKQRQKGPRNATAYKHRERETPYRELDVRPCIANCNSGEFPRGFPAQALGTSLTHLRHETLPHQNRPTKAPLEKLFCTCMVPRAECVVPVLEP